MKPPKSYGSSQASDISGSIQVSKSRCERIGSLKNSTNRETRQGGTWELSIVDENPGLLEDCVDYDWKYDYTLGEDGSQERMTCRDFDSVSNCKNASEIAPFLLDVEFEGRTLLESCCACVGGGHDRTLMNNVLKSWKLSIHGHLAADADTTDLVVVPESTCNITEDACPSTHQFNHICDDTLLNEECMGGDW